MTSKICELVPLSMIVRDLPFIISVVSLVVLLMVLPKALKLNLGILGSQLLCGFGPSRIPGRVGLLRS